jgi:hypothetical protein
MASEFVTARQAAQVLGVSSQKISQARHRADAPDGLCDADGFYNLDLLTELIKIDPAIERKKRIKEKRKRHRRERIGTEQSASSPKGRRGRKPKPESPPSDEESFAEMVNTYALNFWKENNRIVDFMNVEGNTEWIRYFVSEALHYGFEHSK